MKLLRHGLSGHEKPGLLSNGERRQHVISIDVDALA